MFVYVSVQFLGCKYPDGIFNPDGGGRIPYQVSSLKGGLGGGGSKSDISQVWQLLVLEQRESDLVCQWLFKASKAKNVRAVAFGAACE